jgi:hypothetical protein
VPRAPCRKQHTHTATHSAQSLPPCPSHTVTHHAPVPSSLSPSASRHNPTRSSFNPLTGFRFATDFDSITTLLRALCCSASLAAASVHKSGSEAWARAGAQQGGYGERGVGRREGGSEGRGTDIVKGRVATQGGESRE